MKKKMMMMLLLIPLILLASCSNNNSSDEKYITGNNDNIKTQIEKLYKDSNKKTFRLYDLFANNSLMKKTDMIDESTSLEEASTGETSSTNILVPGVDEADLVKNDERYLYTAFKTNNLLVVDSQTLESKEYPMAFEKENEGIVNEYDPVISGLYLTENKLIVISYLRNFSLLVRIYDNTNPLDLVLTREITFNDSYIISSRMIDSKLYLFLETNIIDNEKVLTPKFNDDANGILDFDYSKVSIFGGYEDYCYRNYLNITVVIDTETDEKMIYKGYYGLVNDIYMTKENIYLISSHYVSSNSHVLIYRVRINEKDLEYINMIDIDGFIPDIKAINEYENTLRVAVTYQSSNKANNTVYSNYDNALYVFDVSNDKFDELGHYKNFGEGEKLHGVTYNGNLAYLVTYMYIDPLFEFDLTDPTNIVLVSQLETPGVSEYLDTLDNGYILGIGKDTEVHGEGKNQYATYKGVKLSLYRSENNELSELYTKKFDEYDYSNSSALNDYIRIVKLPNSLRYFIPFDYYLYQYQDDNIYDMEYQSGILGFQVDLENNNIEIIGFISLGKHIYNQRAVVINSNLICVSLNEVKICQASDMNNLLAEIK